MFFVRSCSWNKTLENWGGVVIHLRRALLGSLVSSPAATQPNTVCNSHQSRRAPSVLGLTEEGRRTKVAELLWSRQEIRKWERGFDSWFDWEKKEEKSTAARLPSTVAARGSFGSLVVVLFWSGQQKTRKGEGVMQIHDFRGCLGGGTGPSKTQFCVRCLCVSDLINPYLFLVHHLPKQLIQT